MTSSPPSSANADAQPTSSAFGLLHEKVQRWAWEQGWTEMRDIQEAAVAPILQGAADVIIAAATASGKTEAAFLPICSRLVGAAAGSVRALYVSPLKALINDQYDRLDRLCERLEIPVHRWHGDVAAGKKQQLLREPGGLLLITPESLEALFVVHGPRLPGLFAELSYVVVDELHSFLGTERGRQLQSLLHRLELALRRRVSRIGLSATLGEMGLAADFLRPGGAGQVTVISSTGEGQELKLQLRGYRKSAPRLSAAQAEAVQRSGKEVAVEEVTPGDVLAIVEHLFATLRGADNLIFANSRRDVEIYSDLLRRRCERYRVPNEFWPHHGSLSRELREEVEALLKDRSRPVNVLCTTTLEMGLDIGSVASIVQVGPPPSVASLRQRLGRSGRRGDPAVLRIYIQEAEITDRTPPQDRLRAQLVQAIAMVQLLVARWYEPPSAGELHLSTLVQQLLSLIAQRGGAGALDSWRTLCQTGPFAHVDPLLFARLLRGLGQHDLITQSADGTLLLGPAGEQLVNHHSFYAAFSTPEEYHLMTGGRSLGTLPIHSPLAQGMFLIFAGRRWRVVSVDAERRVIDLLPAAGGRPPIFAGSSGLVHDRVRQEMFAVYTATDIPAFLDAQARELLAEGRAHFARCGLAERPMLAHGQETLLFCWRGDRVMDTLLVQLCARGLKVVRDGLALTVDAISPGELAKHLCALVAAGPADALTLAATVANKREQKYDRFLAGELLNADYATRSLDPQGAWQALNRILAQSSGFTEGPS